MKDRQEAGGQVRVKWGHRTAVNLYFPKALGTSGICEQRGITGVRNPFPESLYSMHARSLHIVLHD